MKTSSSIVLDYLKTLDAEDTFTTKSIHDNLPELSHGSISGFISKLHKESAITVVSRNKSTSGKHLDSYRVVDISSVLVRENMTRTRNVVGNRSGQTTLAHLAGLLLQIASEIENMRSPISDFTTEEIIKELSKRTKNT